MPADFRSFALPGLIDLPAGDSRVFRRQTIREQHLTFAFEQRDAPIAVDSLLLQDRGERRCVICRHHDVGGR
jgi:hypothetical protein